MHVGVYGRMAQMVQCWEVPGEPAKLAHQCFVRIGIPQLCQNWRCQDRHTTALSKLAYHSFVRIEDYDGLGLAC